MKQNILFLTNSNIFTVCSGLYLHKEYDCQFLNLRYANEAMSRNDHFINQINEIHKDIYFNKGLVTTRYTFDYSDRLLYRLKEKVNESNPSVIFLEMKTLDESEWKLLRFLNHTFDIPIITFIPVDEKSKNNMFRLAENGVREVVTQLDEEIFLSATKRNLKLF